MKHKAVEVIPPGLADEIREFHQDLIIRSRILNTDENRAKRTALNPLP